ncbi:MAG: BamA/TamA family outer membrane protein [Ignavibacteriaceae bacterium]|nr:BamA/TamA family outer membrane protein [Ignavibacteriaceae bacterium]
MKTCKVVLLKALPVIFFFSCSLYSQKMDTDSIKGKSSIELLPILSYDTDVGFGFGGKAFFFNQVLKNESFDVILFGSTKGERWFRFVFSYPDFEYRQGSVYPFAIDLIVDYDVWIKNGFYGWNGFSPSDKEFYRKGIFETSLLSSFGLTNEFVLQCGLGFKHYALSNFEKGKMLYIIFAQNEKQNYSLPFITASGRYDSRNSFVNPTKGFQTILNFEYGISSIKYLKSAAEIMYYLPVWNDKMISAFHFAFKDCKTDSLNFLLLPSLGGNNTLRGYPQDRFINNSAVYCNSELRFRLYNRLGGIAGLDFGKTWNAVSKIDLSNWIYSPVIGLRYYMDNFIVRADFSISKETSGFYLNFGHIF